MIKIRKSAIKILLFIILDNFNKLTINKDDLKSLQVICKYDLNNKDFDIIKKLILDKMED